MIIARPFRGIFYNPARAGDESLNLSPPFDAMSPQLEEELLSRSPYNVARLERIISNTTTANPLHVQWMSDGILQRDITPALYVTEEVFEHKGATITRRGVIAAIKLEEYAAKTIFRHETTKSEWVQERVTRMLTESANYSPLLVTAQEPSTPRLGELLRQLVIRPPDLSAAPPGMHQIRLWKVTATDKIAAITAVLRNCRLFIADGHHRYEAALRYRSLQHTRTNSATASASENVSYNYRMMLSIPINDSSLITRGYHRYLMKDVSSEGLTRLESSLSDNCTAVEVPNVVGGLGVAPTLDFESAAASVEALLEERSSKDNGTFLVLDRSGQRLRGFQARYSTHPANKVGDSDYGFLHKCILQGAVPEEQVGFEYNLASTIQALRKGKVVAVFIMRPLSLDTFVKISEQDVPLLPKISNFFPKPPAGSVIQSLTGKL